MLTSIAISCRVRRFSNQRNCTLLVLSTVQGRDGRSKTFSHRIHIRNFCQSSLHRITIFSHCICISHSHRTFRIFSRFCTFSTFLVDISRILHQKIVKSARRMRKRCKNKCENEKKCEKVQTANAMRKWNQN